MSGPAMIPSPGELFARFERGEMDREELHAMMAVHARELIAEMEEDRLNPAAAMIENLLSRRAAARLARRHGAVLLREVFAALAEVPDFPPAKYLWNATHPDVPLYCFLRMRREPVFRIIEMRQSDGFIEVTTEHGSSRRGLAIRSTFTLRRDARWRLRVETCG
jgi:hypothetical protein